jgi:hypothetical protein
MITPPVGLTVFVNKSVVGRYVSWWTCSGLSCRPWLAAH